MRQEWAMSVHSSKGWLQGCQGFVLGRPPVLPQVIATALHVIVNCVTAPPSLAYLLPPPGSAAGKRVPTLLTAGGPGQD